MAVRLVPSGWSRVMKPSVPGGGAALASPLLTSNADPAVTATTTTPDTARVNEVLLRMI
jgi:hypothetical protein